MPENAQTSHRGTDPEQKRLSVTLIFLCFEILGIHEVMMLNFKQNVAIKR